MLFNLWSLSMYIYKAAVVGGGTMGGAIAQVITYSGIPVVVKDINRPRFRYNQLQ